MCKAVGEDSMQPNASSTPLSRLPLSFRRQICHVDCTFQRVSRLIEVFQKTSIWSGRFTTFVRTKGRFKGLCLEFHPELPPLILLEFAAILSPRAREKK
jgi:hypothetical protein